MARTPNYQKWQLIYSDYQKGAKWEELVKKHKTSKRTISRAIKYYNNLDNVELGYETVQDRAKKIIRTIEVLNNQTRLRLVTILIMYNELSLNRLSKKLGLSKSTALRHLKDLEEAELVNIRREKVRGPRLKQYYSVTPLLRNTPDPMKFVRLSHEMLRKFPPEEALEALISDLKADASFFSIIKMIFDDIITYNKELQENLSVFRPTNYEIIEKLFSTENHYRYLFWYLTKPQYEAFRLRYQEFTRKLREDFELLAEENKDVIDEKHPYFVFHTLIPLKKIFDRKSER